MDPHSLCSKNMEKIKYIPQPQKTQTGTEVDCIIFLVLVWYMLSWKQNVRWMEWNNKKNWSKGGAYGISVYIRYMSTLGKNEFYVRLYVAFNVCERHKALDKCLTENSTKLSCAMD